MSKNKFDFSPDCQKWIFINFSISPIFLSPACCQKNSISLVDANSRRQFRVENLIFPLKFSSSSARTGWKENFYETQRAAAAKLMARMMAKDLNRIWDLFSCKKSKFAGDESSFSWAAASAAVCVWMWDNRDEADSDLIFRIRLCRSEMQTSLAEEEKKWRKISSKIHSSHFTRIGSVENKWISV